MTNRNLHIIMRKPTQTFCYEVTFYPRNYEVLKCEASIPNLPSPQVEQTNKHRHTIFISD